MNIMLTAPADVEGVHGLGSDHCVIDFHLTQNGVKISPRITRVDAEMLRALLADWMASTQDAVTEPELLARVIPK